MLTKFSRDQRSIAMSSITYLIANFRNLKLCIKKVYRSYN